MLIVVFGKLTSCTHTTHITVEGSADAQEGWWVIVDSHLEANASFDLVSNIDLASIRSHLPTTIPHHLHEFVFAFQLRIDPS